MLKHSEVFVRDASTGKAVLDVLFLLRRGLRTNVLVLWVGLYFGRAVVVGGKLCRSFERSV